MKTSKVSFSKEMLPLNRKMQFFDILKQRYALLIAIGFTLLIAIAPLVFFYGSTVYLSNVSVFEKIMETYSIAESEAGFVYFWMINILYLIMIPFFLLFFVVLAGELRIYRLLGWGEGVFYFHDLFKGIKTNYKNALIYGAIISVYIWVHHFIGGAVTLYINGSIGIIVELILKAILVLFILPILIISFFLTTYFTNTFKNSVKTAVKIYLFKFFPLFLYPLGILLIYSFPYLGNYYIILFLCVVIIVFVFPIYILLWNQSFLNVIDKYVGVEEAKLKGLYDPSKINNK